MKKNKSNLRYNKLLLFFLFFILLFQHTGCKKNSSNSSLTLVVSCTSDTIYLNSNNQVVDVNGNVIAVPAQISQCCNPTPQPSPNKGISQTTAGGNANYNIYLTMGPSSYQTTKYLLSDSKLCQMCTPENCDQELFEAMSSAATAAGAASAAHTTASNLAGMSTAVASTNRDQISNNGLSSAAVAGSSPIGNLSQSNLDSLNTDPSLNGTNGVGEINYATAGGSNATGSPSASSPTVIDNSKLNQTNKANNRKISTDSSNLSDSIGTYKSGGSSLQKIKNSDHFQENESVENSLNSNSEVNLTNSQNESSPVLISEDPEDYFTRMDLQNSIFKEIHQFYQKKTATWIVPLKGN